MGGGVPGIVGRESVVDVHLDVVLVLTEVSALSDPIDQPGGQQEPLELGSAVVEIERQFRHPRLGISGRDAGARVLVDAGQGVAGAIGYERCISGATGRRRRVAVGAGGERNGPGQLRKGGKAGGRERPGGTVQCPAGRVCGAQGGIRVHVAVHLAGPKV